MLLLRASSPIGPLLALSTHAPTLVSLLIALGELAVGLGTLLGLWTRIAAAGGALLSLTFFLTVSWNTTPYYYGADIGFMFSWLVLLAFGSVGVLSVDAWLRNRARVALRLGPEPASIAIDVPRLQKLCARGQKCGLAADGHCTRLSGCPVFPVHETLPTRLREELDRRLVVAGGAAAAVVGIFALLFGGITAIIGRAGSPAWVVHPSGNTFVAFSAICTHAGCTVQYDPSNIQFICPCHSGVYDARTGQVLQGPPPAPLPSIPVHVADGKIHVG